jgi:hypothetical protein
LNPEIWKISSFSKNQSDMVHAGRVHYRLFEKEGNPEPRETSIIEVLSALFLFAFNTFFTKKGNV